LLQAFELLQTSELLHDSATASKVGVTGAVTRVTSVTG